MIKHALDAGYRRIVVGLGGSATVDGGAGLAQALGIAFLDSSGFTLNAHPASLEKLTDIDLGSLDPRIKETEILAACDVTNPLCGPQGAAAVFGPQKGAGTEELARLDYVLRHVADLFERKTGKDVRQLPGAGAAGGLGAGLACLGAKLWPGIELVMAQVGFEKMLTSGVDLVITGEGELNYQTVYGKVPIGVAKAAARYKIPVIALAGSLGPGAEEVYQHGISSLMSIQPRPMTLEYCMKNAAVLVVVAAERMIRVITIYDY